MLDFISYSDRNKLGFQQSFRLLFTELAIPKKYLYQFLYLLIQISVNSRYKLNQRICSSHGVAHGQLS